MIILDIDSWLEPIRCDQLCICSDPRTNVLGSGMHMDTRVQFKAGHESAKPILLFLSNELMIMLDRQM